MSSSFLEPENTNFRKYYILYTVNITKLSLHGPVLNPHTPVAQKIADEVVFRRFQGEGVEFC